MGFLRLFNLFQKSGLWQKRLTVEDTEDRRGALFYSASFVFFAADYFINCIF